MQLVPPGVSAALSAASLALAVAGGVVAGALSTPAVAAPAVVAAPVAAAPVVVAPVAVAPVTAPATTKSTSSTSTTTPSVDRSRCTNRIDYTNDPRDNATINSIGSQTGTCPEPLDSVTDGTGGTGTCLDTDSCYDPAGRAPGEGVPDEEYYGTGRDFRDANGETYYEACRRMGYEPGPSCPAG